MASPTKSKLPVPRTWLPRSPSVAPSLTPREAALLGSTPGVGTKSHFRGYLLGAGWDTEHIEPVLSGRFSPAHFVKPLDVEDIDINKIRVSLKERGFSAVPWESSSDNTTCQSTRETWNSLTRRPVWLTGTGPKTAMMVGKTLSLVRRASAAFCYDVWATLGDPPEYRMPSIKRINLLSYMSPEGLARFESHVAPTTDIIIISGIDSKNQVYNNTGYIEAMSRVANHAFLLYECVPDDDLDDVTLSTAARRNSIRFLWRIANG